MQLLDRYLQSVANFLPAKNREDILAELRANLTAEFEAQQEATGRPLTEDDEADILRKHGSPIIVASRYFPQQYLIGPGWIATYWFVLKIGLAASAAVTLVISLMFVALDKISAAELLAMWLRYPATALTVFAWVTLIFATSEYFARRYHWKEGLSEFRWDPRKLPVLRLNGEPAGGSPKSDFFGACIGLLILVALSNWTYAIPLALRHGIGFTHAWRTLYEFLLVSAILSVITAFARMLRPDWGIVKPLSGLVTSAIVFVGVANFLRHGPWLVPSATATPPLADFGPRNLFVLWNIRAWMIGMAIAIVVYGWSCVSHLRQRSPRTGVSPVII
jgi:hypothetical protein